MIVTMTCPGCGTSFDRRHDRPGYCTRSCSARSRTGASNSNWRGGKRSHPLDGIYKEMLGRCYRPSNTKYADYGGRWITVCQRWREDFWAFVADMGDRPGGVGTKGRAEYSIDRVDNDGNYEPGNVRWATSPEQAANRRAPKKRAA